MKLKKIISSLIFTMIFTLVFAFGQKAFAQVEYKVEPGVGTLLQPGSKIVVTVSETDKTKGFNSLTIRIYDADTNVLLNSNTITATDTTKGNQDIICQALVPGKCTADKIKVVADAVAYNGSTSSKTFEYKGPGNVSEGNPGRNNSNTLTIKATDANGSTVSSGERVESGQTIKFITTCSNSVVGVKTTKVTIRNRSTNEKIYENTFTANSSLGASPYTVNKNMPTVAGTYEVVIFSRDINGLEATKTYIFYVGTNGNSDVIVNDNDNDDNNNDDDAYDGVLNKNLDGLAIDLWLKEKKRFYELEDDEIPFVAYYYNYEKKAAKDVKIEIEIPDGFKVVSKYTPNGSVKLKNDTLVYTIGTLESKELKKVYFTLKAEEDDVCDEVTEIEAVIYKDKDEEEDSSTQRIWIYEEGDRGSFNSYVTGYPDGTFRPDNNITREEVAAMMARAFNHTAISTTRTFSDIKAKRWSYNYIMACATKGIITGYPDGSFKPFNSIQRSELYAMTYRAMGLDVDDEKALFIPKQYKNDDSWETNYVAGLARLRMLQDMKDTDADEDASRADVVYLINSVQFRNPSKMMDVSYSDLRSSHWCAKDIAAASCNYSFKRGSNGKEVVIK